MANLQLYTAAFVYVNGALLAEEASVTVNRSTNSQQVITVSKGYAGESPGAAMCEVTVESAVPAADFELDTVVGKPMEIEQLKVVEFTIFAAGSTLSFKGFIISDNFSHAANTESKLSFSARGQFANWD